MTQPTAAAVQPTIEQRPDVRLDDGSGDHERLAHYVPKADIVRSAVTGEAVIALCGKKWIPTRDPERFPVCPECKAIFAARAKGGGQS